MTYLTVLLALSAYTALNAFVFRLYFNKKKYNPDHFTTSAKQSRFSMNLLNICVVATAFALWFHTQETLINKLSATLFACVAGYFISTHFKLMRKIIKTEDMIIGHGLNFIVFVVVFILTLP